MFDEVDSDGSGTITRKELHALLKSCGVWLTRRQLVEVVDMLAVKRSGSGHIEREEFCQWWMAQGKYLADDGQATRAGKKGQVASCSVQRVEEEMVASARDHAQQKWAARASARAEERSKEVAASEAPYNPSASCG
jgi:hypothetical protein